MSDGRCPCCLNPFVQTPETPKSPQETDPHLDLDLEQRQLDQKRKSSGHDSDVLAGMVFVAVGVIATALNYYRAQNIGVLTGICVSPFIYGLWLMLRSIKS